MSRIMMEERTAGRGTVPKGRIVDETFPPGLEVHDGTRTIGFSCVSHHSLGIPATKLFPFLLVRFHWCSCVSHHQFQITFSTGDFFYIVGQCFFFFVFNIYIYTRKQCKNISRLALSAFFSMLHNRLLGAFACLPVNSGVFLRSLASFILGYSCL